VRKITKNDTRWPPISRCPAALGPLDPTLALVYRIFAGFP
jgi:hypothetical protein